MHVALHVDSAHPAPFFCSSSHSCPTELTSTRARPAPRSQRHLPARSPCPWLGLGLSDCVTPETTQPAAHLPANTAGAQGRTRRLVTSGTLCTNLPASRRKRQGNHQIKETTKPVSASPHPHHLWTGSIGNQTSCTHTAYRTVETGAYRPLPL